MLQQLQVDLLELWVQPGELGQFVIKQFPGLRRIDVGIVQIFRIELVIFDKAVIGLLREKQRGKIMRWKAKTSQHPFGRPGTK